MQSRTCDRVQCCHWVLRPDRSHTWLRWPHRHSRLGEAAQGCSAHSGSLTQREKQPWGSSLASQEENSAGNQEFCAMQAAPEERWSGHPGLRSSPSPQGEATFASFSGHPGAALPGAAKMSAAKELPGISKHWCLNEL